MAPFSDPLSRKAVEAFLNAEYFLLSSHQLKTFGRLGDRMAVACHLVTRNAALFGEPEYAERVMTAIRVAFSAPADIACKSDRLPAFSIHLLERLKSMSGSAKVRHTADELLAELRSLCEAVESEFVE